MQHFTEKNLHNTLQKSSYLLILSLLITISLPGMANAATYWSLGSFKIEANARQERDRIESRTGLAVTVARSGGLYRIVLEKDANPQAQKSTIEALGLSPWTLWEENLDLLESATRMSPPAAAPGKTGHYLVLASFADVSTAHRLLDVLTRNRIEPVKIAPAEVHGSILYRVLHGPFDTRLGVDEDFRIYGITDPWWIHVEATAPESHLSDVEPYIEEIEVEAPGMEDDPVAPPAEVTPEPAYTLSPPRESESYVDYCVLRANPQERAVYCQDDTFIRAATPEIRSKKRR